MRSHLGIVSAILITGLISGSSVPTSTLPKQVTLNPGDQLTIEVITFYDVVRECYLVSPDGIKTEFKPNDDSFDKFKLIPDTDTSQCGASMKIDVNDDGLWTLTSVAEDGTRRVRIYNISVNDDPDAENNKHVEYLDNVLKNTTIGARHTFYIRDISFGDTISCHIIKPTGIKIDIKEIDAAGINDTISRTTHSKCSISLNVASEDVIGDWMLVSVGHRYSEKIERRLPFTIHVEEFVGALRYTVDVREGNSFYIGVLYFKREYNDTCKLLEPNGLPAPPARVHRFDKCTFRVDNVTMSDSGDWEINYGNKILYRAVTSVTVHGAPTNTEKYFFWTKDKPVKETLGPENAIYCRIRSPEGFAVYSGFGRCVINLDRVIKSKHQGTWKMEVGMPGHVISDIYKVNVIVQEADPKLKVLTSIHHIKADGVNVRNMTLSCHLSGAVRGDSIGVCQFRDPSGRILMAAEAVAQSRYSWYSSGNYTAEFHECGLHITNTIISDYGIWRCEIDTPAETYYGFLTAKPDWIRDPEIAASITTVPTLKADRSLINSVSGDSVTMSCSIQAPIRYCYFRARNGTVFNVAPSESHDLATYVGAGFEAGECGVSFPGLAATDSGYWSCHVGLLGRRASEQRARFELIITDAMEVSQHGPTRDKDMLVIKGLVHTDRPLDYCRFVRIDGLGFTDQNMPPNTDNWSDLSRGLCSITIWNPSTLDLHPWVVAARITGQETELMRTTELAFPSDPTPPAGGGAGRGFRFPGAWIVVMSIGMCMILMAGFVGPRRNREWTYARASAIRSSFTAKKAAQSANDASQNTAVAA